MAGPSADNPIDSAGPVKATLSNLFYGWGYNFYRRENQLRADDLLIRAKVSELIGQCRGHLNRLEADFRRTHLPPPTREHPLPDAAAVSTARAAERAQRDLEALETRIRNAAVPEMDRVFQRHRNERATLEQLAALDGELVGTVVALRDRVVQLTDLGGAAEDLARLAQASGIEAIWARREQVLSI